MKFSQLPTPLIVLSGFLLFVSLTLSVICFTWAVRFSGGRRFALYSGLIFVLSAPFTFGVEHVLWSRKHPDFSSAYGTLTASLPAWLILPAALVLFAAGGSILFCFLRHRGAALCEESVFEGLDFLPEGVAFSDRHGLPVLVNNQMHEILYDAFGLATMDLDYMHRRLDRSELEPGCSKVPYEGGLYLIMPDGRVWDLRETSVSVNGSSFRELLAFDVTCLYRGNEELKERNGRLAAVNEQIREYSRNMDGIVREREILKAKIRLHDEFGKALLAVRGYLSGQNRDREALLELLKAPVFLFQNDGDESLQEDSVALLEEAAKAIGVTIRYDGVLPSAHTEILSVAIHECLTNTVKHARGHNLYVKSTNEGDCRRVEFTNDGMAPAEKIRETGGLKNLRDLCERSACRMTVESSPKFRLILEFDEPVGSRQ